MMTTNSGLAGPPRPPIGLLLRKLDGLINERFERTLAIRGVTRRQWQLLHTLAADVATLDALTGAVSPFLDRASGETARRHLDPLAHDGLLRAEGDVYSLTDTGRALFENLAGEVRAIRELTVAGLPEGEYERTIATLQAMIGNLETNT